MSITYNATGSTPHPATLLLARGQTATDGRKGILQQQPSQWQWQRQQRTVETTAQDLVP